LGSGVIIETVVAKYGEHLPLYRQEAMIEREAGVEILQSPEAHSGFPRGAPTAGRIGESVLQAV
jgi:transposase